MTAGDPDILSVAGAARLAGMDRHTFARYLADESCGLRAAVVIDLPGRIRISRPRLLRHLHGEPLVSVEERAS